MDPCTVASHKRALARAARSASDEVQGHVNEFIRAANAITKVNEDAIKAAKECRNAANTYDDLTVPADAATVALRTTNFLARFCQREADESARELALTQKTMLAVQNLLQQTLATAAAAESAANAAEAAVDALDGRRVRR